jgi:hypothetical protein
MATPCITVKIGTGDEYYVNMKGLDTKDLYDQNDNIMEGKMIEKLDILRKMYLDSKHKILEKVVRRLDEKFPKKFEDSELMTDYFYDISKIVPKVISLAPYTEKEKKYMLESYRNHVIDKKLFMDYFGVYTTDDLERIHGSCAVSTTLIGIPFSYTKVEIKKGIWKDDKIPISVIDSITKLIRCILEDNIYDFVEKSIEVREKLSIIDYLKEIIGFICVMPLIGIGSMIAIPCIIKYKLMRMYYYYDHEIVSISIDTHEFN